MSKLNKAAVFSLALTFFWALSASLSDAYAPAPSAFAAAKTVAPCKPAAGQPERKALGQSPFLEPEDGILTHVEFAKSLKLNFPAAKPLQSLAGVEIRSPKLMTPVVNPFATLSTPVLVL